MTLELESAMLSNFEPESAYIAFNLNLTFFELAHRYTKAAGYKEVRRPRRLRHASHTAHTSQTVCPYKLRIRVSCLAECAACPYGEVHLSDEHCLALFRRKAKDSTRTFLQVYYSTGTVGACGRGARIFHTSCELIP